MLFWVFALQLLIGCSEVEVKKTTPIPTSKSSAKTTTSIKTFISEPKNGKDKCIDQLSDHSSFGKAYTLNQTKSTMKIFRRNSIRVMDLVQRVYPFDECLVLFVELQPINGKGKAFLFDDCQTVYGNMYSSIRDSKKFRVTTLKCDDGSEVYIIRGFDEKGKCIYYREWDTPLFDEKKEKTNPRVKEKEKEKPVDDPKTEDKKAPPSDDLEIGESILG